MAEKVLDITDLASVPRAGRLGQYDWVSWSDGSVWRIRTPEDFTCSVDAIRRLVHAQAKQRNMKAITRIDPENEKSLLIRFSARSSDGRRSRPGGQHGPGAPDVPRSSPG